MSLIATNESMPTIIIKLILLNASKAKKYLFKVEQVKTGVLK